MSTIDHHLEARSGLELDSETVSDSLDVKDAHARPRNLFPWLALFDSEFSERYIHDDGHLFCFYLGRLGRIQI
jgi:hypothetical protein